jgi:predicted RNA-binding protein YlqC (UPF0109 family)
MNSARELPTEAWSEYLEALSRELLNAPVSIEVTEESGPTMVEAERLALQALLYDRRDDVFEVAVARRGEHVPGLLRHLVDHPSRLAIDTETMLAPMTISVDGRDGARTVIRVQREETPAPGR